MKWLIASVLLLTLGFCATAAPFRHRAFEHAPLVTTRDIEKWISPNERGEVVVTSVESLLAKLPATYRAYSVYQFASGGQHRVSSTNPRVIFFGPDARLLMAVSTDAADPKAQVVELIEFDPETATFATAELNFARPVNRRLERSPASCIKCHRAEVRPNWEPYDAWPGTFGGVHDTIPGKTLQATWFTNLVKRAKSDPRLKYTGLTQIDDTKIHADDTRYTAARGIGANAGMSVTINFANRERITRQLVSSAHHDRYRAALAAAMVGCPDSIDDFLPASLPTKHPRAYSEIENETREWMLREHEQRILATSKLLRDQSVEQVENEADRYGKRANEVRRTARLRYLMENRSLNALRVQDWSTAFDEAAYAFNDGVSGLENLIGHYLPRAFSDRPELLAIAPYKSVDFSVTSFNELTHGSGADLFGLELYELKSDKIAAFCAALKKEI